MCQTSLVVLVKTQNFRCRECVLVQSLVGELRYSMPHYVAKKKQKNVHVFKTRGSKCHLVSHRPWRLWFMFEVQSWTLGASSLRQTGSISGHTNALLAQYIVGIFPH